MSKSAIMLWSDVDSFSSYVLSTYVVLQGKELPFTLKAVDLSSSEHLHPSQ